MTTAPLRTGHLQQEQTTEAVVRSQCPPALTLTASSKGIISHHLDDPSSSKPHLPGNSVDTLDSDLRRFQDHLPRLPHPRGSTRHCSRYLRLWIRMVGFTPRAPLILGCVLRLTVGFWSVGSGQLSEKELRAALVNGDWTSFDPHTVRMMIRLQFLFLPDELCLIYIDSTYTECSILIVPVQSASMNSGPSSSLP